MPSATELEPFIIVHVEYHNKRLEGPDKKKSISSTFKIIADNTTLHPSSRLQ